jgi:hypothetical protein
MSTKKVNINTAIQHISNAISAMHTYPERYKAVYKHAGSIDNFKGPEMFMDDVEPSLKYSKNTMKKAIDILKELQ